MSCTYKGIRDGSWCSVTVDGRPLDPRVDLGNHSPSGFDWGNDGSGSAQLALAMLADHAGDEVALRVYPEFQTAVVAGLPCGRWTLSRDDIDSALAAIETTGAHGSPEALTARAAGGRR
jgi:hypothetical protein